jgi:hypothetical protein
VEFSVKDQVRLDTWNSLAWNSLAKAHDGIPALRRHPPRRSLTARWQLRQSTSRHQAGSVRFGSMHADTVVALVAAGLAAIIAITVPWMTFRLALRQDQTRWLRDQRAQIYVDLLTEADAECEYLAYVMALPETSATMRTIYTDVRLPPLERARLSARGTIFGSHAVNRLFNELQA